MFLFQGNQGQVDFHSAGILIGPFKTPDCCLADFISMTDMPMALRLCCPIQ